ncbi:hypothetical protein [Streptomyces sp. BBFR102]
MLRFGAQGSRRNSHVPDGRVLAVLAVLAVLICGFLALGAALT